MWLQISLIFSTFLEPLLQYPCARTQVLGPFEGGGAYEQKRVDLATLRALPASTWGHCPQGIFLLEFGTHLERTKFPNELLPPPGPYCYFRGLYCLDRGSKNLSQLG